jgi:hypothetical protein
LSEESEDTIKRSWWKREIEFSLAHQRQKGGMKDRTPGKKAGSQIVKERLQIFGCVGRHPCRGYYVAVWYCGLEGRGDVVSL